MTTVVNIRDGFPSGAVYIGRPGRGMDGYFGNPFPANRIGGRTTAIERYRRWFHARLGADPGFRTQVESLRGKQLVCFCAPLPCHGDVIAEFLDSRQPSLYERVK